MSRNVQMRVAIAILLAAGLAGCAAGPDYLRPADPLPKTYTPTAVADGGQVDGQTYTSGQDLPVEWWRLFHSQALDDLVVASLKRNPNVAAAQAALRGALENVAAQQGAFFPTVDASFSPTRQKVSGVLSSPTASNAYYYNLHTAQVTVSYAPDLFGANRRQVESLQAQAAAQRYQNEVTYLTLASNVVMAAIAEAALRGQIVATREIVTGQTRVLTMMRRQFELGQVAAADVAVQEAALAAAEATLPPLQKQLAAQRNLLTALAGGFPGDAAIPAFDLGMLELPETLPLTLPSTLVERRPDVRAAEELLHAASADIGVAAANRLPNVTLGVDAFGSAAGSIGDLFSSGTGFWTLAANVAQPVFDGGVLKHRQGAAQAAYDGAAATYRATVLNAFQNVADALQAIDFDAAALRAAAGAERAASKSLVMARRQLALGDISALGVLAGEQADQQAKVNLVQAQANRLADTVALFQALGGGWWHGEEHPAQAAAAR